MLMVIPTYTLTATVNGTIFTLRVPKTQLNAILEVLVFNGLEHCVVDLEGES